MINTLAEYTAGDFTVRYQADSASQVGLLIYPASLQGYLAERRTTLWGESFIDAKAESEAPPAIAINPLAHIKIVGDSYSGAFAQGRTMLASPSNAHFRLEKHSVVNIPGARQFLTQLVSDEGLQILHTLLLPDNGELAEVRTTFVNGSSQPVTLEMLTSFALGGITPFDPSDAAGRLRVHRFRSVWSAEGRLDTQTIEQLHLERSWSGSGLFSERFGQIGTMPVRGWFPFVAIEDTAAGVTWGAQLAWAGSWQMEISRQHDDIGISGGLADRELGHWTKTLTPGEAIEAPPATISCVAGGLDDLCDRLTAAQQPAADDHPLVEADLPIVFNEWCTTWGDPAEDKVTAIADSLAGSPVQYLVIDAGWYKRPATEWHRAHGDWIPSEILFPRGLKSIADAIRQRGLIPGLWFEMETVGDQSVAFSLADHLLKRDGIPVTVRNRRFWDLNDPFAVDYLVKKVIDLLQECGFGYLKVDYNETAGIGFDGAESLGEGLRRQVLGSYRFFDRIRQCMPDLVIENCASGGHRLEPSMLGRTAMSSFSDAHELVEIPIIAANLHRLILPRQSQIWAVLQPNDTDRRLTYSLAATFLGRMCLSGNIIGLSASQRAIVDAAMQLQRLAAPIIKQGISRIHQNIGPSWRKPSGTQSVIRSTLDGNHALVVTHAFNQAPLQFSAYLPGCGGWRIDKSFGRSEEVICDGDALSFSISEPFTGRVDLLSRGTR